MVNQDSIPLTFYHPDQLEAKTASTNDGTRFRVAGK